VCVGGGGAISNKMDSKINRIGYSAFWNSLAEDGDKCWAVVNTIVKICIQ
jgi:hypothetical protein